jgi:acetyl esterase/lipase
MPTLRATIIQRIMRDFKNALLLDVPIETRRQRLDAVARRGIRVPRGVSVQTVAAGPVPGEWIKPETVEPGRGILYLHGGGYVIGSPTTHRGLAGHLAIASRAKILLIDYRLAPEHPFPAALEDALAAYRFLCDQGFDPRHLVIGGDSAGGGLSLATALSLRDSGAPLPAALFLISPWTDLTFSGNSVHERAERDPLLKPYSSDWLVEVYAGTYPLTHPYISPLFADLHGLPPTLIQVGSEEILFDDSARLEMKLKEAGVPVELEVWEEMWHVFHAFVPYLPEAWEAIQHIGQFIEKTLGEQGNAYPATHQFSIVLACMGQEGINLVD